MLNWIKKNKIIGAVIIIVAGWVLVNFANTFFGVRLNSLSISNPSPQYESDYISEGSFGELAPAAGVSKSLALPSVDTSTRSNYTPQPDAENRLVIQTSNVSLLVKDVIEVRNKILNYASTSGGYMVNVSTSNPEETPTATIVIRVPAVKLSEALDYFHSLSVKVVSENLVGRDVTDQYVDIDKRIAIQERTKAKYEQILDAATEISDITSLTQQIIYTQNQIDSLKGQQDSLEKNAELAKLTIYLATDEIALPYAPSETFQPEVIFKLAVRSLVKSLRGLAKLAIWIGVYAVIWVPAIIIFKLVRNWLKKRKTTPTTVN